MPKKPPSNRLDKLFENIGQEDSAPSETPERNPPARADRKKSPPRPPKTPKPAARSTQPAQASALPPLETAGFSQPAAQAAPGVMSLGLQLDEKTWATLEVVDEDSLRVWDENDELLVRQVTDQLSQALENARLFQETQTRAEELAILNEMGRELTTLLDPESIAACVYKHTSRLMDTTNLFISLYNEKRQEVHPFFVINNHERLQVKPRKLGNGLSDYILRHREPIFIPDNMLESMKQLGIEVMLLGSTTEMAQCWVGTPLLTADAIIGVIGLQSVLRPNVFTERHRDLLTAIAGRAAIAIESARLFNETQRRAEELTALNQLVQRLSARLDVNQVLQEIHAGVSRLIDTKNFYIALFDAEKNEVHFPLNVTESVVDKNILIIRPDQGMTGYILRSREPLLIEENVREVMESRGVHVVGQASKSWLGVPLLLGEQAIGVMAVQSFDTPGAFNEHDRDLLAAFAGQAAISIQNARLFTQSRRREEELAALNEFAQRLSAQLDINQVLDETYQGISRLMDTKNFYIGLYDPEKDLVSFVLNITESEVDRNITTIQGGQGMSGYIIKNKTPILVRGDWNKIVEEMGIAAVGEPAASWLGVPLLLGNQAIGVMALQSFTETGVYGEHERDLLIAFASQAAISIQNARLFTETERRSQEISALAEVTSAASQSLDLKAILTDVLNKVLASLQFEGGVVTIFNEKRGKLERAVRIGLPGDMPEDPAEGLEDSLCEYIYKTGEAMAINDLSQGAPVDVSSNIEQGFLGYLGIPIHVRGVTAGTMCVFRQETTPIPERTIVLGQSIGNQIGFAIENARLFEATRSSQEALARSEGELRALFFAMTDVIIIYDREGRYVRIAPTNPSRLFLPPEDMLGKKLSDVLPESMHVPFLSAIHRALASNQLERHEYSLNIEDREYWFEANISKLTEDQVFWVARDITERKKAEGALKRRNDYLAATADIGQLVTSTLDLPTLFSRTVNLVGERFGFYATSLFTIEETGFNAVLQAVTGAAGEELRRQEFSLPVGSKSAIGEATGSGRAVVINDTSQSDIFQFNPHLPETRSEAVIPLRIGSRIIGVLDLQSAQAQAFSEDEVMVLQTLADQVAIAIDNARSYELSIQAVKEMREADRLKSQFLANMSHELRTPLNSIIGFSRVILKGIDGPISDLQQQDLLAIHNSGQHLLGLINDILDLSRIEAGKMELTFDEVHLHELIAGVMSTAVGLVKDKAIQLQREIPESLPAVRADSMRIRQVLLNLLSNASKFTDDGTITVTAELVEHPGGRAEVMVRVKDTGPGISKDDQKKLFQPFSQVDASPTRKTGGSGLGLSISNHLVQMHGGRMGVESEVGAGSTFYFTLPTFHNLRREGAHGSNRVILAIDDDPQVISLYERYLQPQGYEVVPLYEPARAAERAEQVRPFAITLDIMMPGYDGWKVLNDLKSNPLTRDIPVVVCTIVEEQEKGFSLGAADYLLKPILEEDILGALDRLNADGSIRDVLIVDDDPHALRLIDKMLSEHGRYRPVMAEGGRNGWESILARPPHALILDLFMPDLDGFTILERMRGDETLRDIPVVIVSGGDLNTEQQEQLRDFGQRMIRKGMLTEKELLDTLERALKRVQN
ncbi:MAG: Sensor histidine kinase RcsC [Anaerolineales bacterium]|nr:Sensor histidine kinase RcsC [Anaerolineales bacterium]